MKLQELLLTINNIITTGFIEKQPPKRTVMIAVDMSKAFETVHLMDKITKRNNCMVFFHNVEEEEGSTPTNRRKGITSGIRQKKDLYRYTTIMVIVM